MNELDLQTENDLTANIRSLEEEQRRLVAQDRPGDKAWAKHYQPLKNRVDTQLTRARQALAKLQAKAKSGSGKRRESVKSSKQRENHNKRRAERACKILIRYSIKVRTPRRGVRPEPYPSQDDLVDLLTDLRHLAERDPELDYDSADAAAQDHFDHELAEAVTESAPTPPEERGEQKRHIQKSSRPFSII